MWTCSKCGEAIEDQFDSCWKCAGQTEKVLARKGVERLAWYHYILAAVMAYLIPWLAGLVQTSFWLIHLKRVSRNVSEVNDVSLFSAIKMLVIPGAITFLVLLPFLRYRDLRWAVAGLVLVAWMCLMGGR